MKDPKFDKAMFSKIFEEAKARFINNGYSYGNAYLTSGEAQARAYTEAALAVLNAQGYVVVNKNDPSKN